MIQSDPPVEAHSSHQQLSAAGPPPPPPVLCPLPQHRAAAYSSSSPHTSAPRLSPGYLLLSRRLLVSGADLMRCLARGRGVSSQKALNFRRNQYQPIRTDPASISFLERKKVTHFWVPLRKTETPCIYQPHGVDNPPHFVVGRPAEILAGVTRAQSSHARTMV